MDYPEIPMPRENDRCIMTLAIQLQYRGEDLRSVNRCRISSCSIFLSDIASASGRTLDQTQGLQGIDYASSSTYDFPTECPSQRDWEVWRGFWSSYCLPDGTLPCSLGKWKNATHRQWEWFLYGFEGGHSAQIACDNLSGLFKSKERRKKIPPGSKNADILRSLRRVHSSLKCKCAYVHVYGHQDKHKTWDQMSILERLNYRCDELAKQAVKRGIHYSHITSPMTRQILPMESVAVFHGGQKIIGECGSEIRYQIGKVEARDFYINKLGWYAAVFDNVDWAARDKVLSRKPDMFRMWVVKQSSGFISSGKNMRRWFGSEHTQCPNCGKEDEDAQHLMHCPDPGRYALFREEVNKLTVWLEMNHTDPILAKIISRYVRSRGSTRLADFHDVPPEYYKFVYEQQLIGWDNFMLGIITSTLRPLQHGHLLGSSSLLTVDDWLTQLINKILHITHGQWIYRNIPKHHATLGMIRKTERRAMLLEIDRLTQLTPEDVPEDSKFLLEIDFSTLRYADTSTQNYWVHAVKAAVVAGSRRTFFQRRRRFPTSSGRRQQSSISPPIPYGSNDVRPAGSIVLGKHSRHSSGDILDGSNKRRKPD
eukprot:scaffold51495_cov38-Cyclotella_meneghiniana.AAC.3